MKKQKITKMQYIEICVECGKELVSENKAQLLWNFDVHQKSCKGGKIKNERP